MTNSMAPGTTRRRLLAGGAAALIGGVGALRHANAQAPAAGGLDYAVFTELSPASKVLKGGWNTRVFTNTDARKGDAITRDFATGIVTVAPGVYHIGGMSIVAYMSGDEPPEMATIRAQPRPATVGCAGLVPIPSSIPACATSATMIPASYVWAASTANLSPSLFEVYFETDRPARMLLEHQSGSNPEQIYLRVFTQNSKWHAMARMAVRRV